MKLYKKIKKIVCKYCDNKGMCAKDVKCNQVDELEELLKAGGKG